MISFVVHGPPVAAARPRLSRGKTYDPRSAERKQVEAIIREELLTQGWELSSNLLAFHLEVYQQVPVSEVKRFQQPTYHVGRCDIDNFLKFYMDCCTGLAWKDDRQVVEVSGCKMNSLQPYVEICIQELV